MEKCASADVGGLGRLVGRARQMKSVVVGLSTSRRNSCAARKGIGFVEAVIKAGMGSV